MVVEDAVVDGEGRGEDDEHSVFVSVSVMLKIGIVIISYEGGPVLCQRRMPKRRFKEVIYP